MVCKHNLGNWFHHDFWCFTHQKFHGRPGSRGYCSRSHLRRWWFQPRIPWAADGMHGMTCYILQTHLHHHVRCGFVQKWGRKRDRPTVALPTIVKKSSWHVIETVIPVIIALYTHFVDPFRWWYLKTIGLLWAILWPCYERGNYTRLLLWTMDSQFSRHPRIKKPWLTGYSGAK